jgi:hypothetical protein
VTGWLLDTNFLSELRRPKPEPKVLAFIGAHPLDHVDRHIHIFYEFAGELVAKHAMNIHVLIGRRN